MQARSAREALEREVYWLGTTDPGETPATGLGELLSTLERLERALHADANRSVPTALLRMPPSPLRRRLKGLMHRVLRPVTRRQDRIAAELAAAVLDLTEHVVRLETELGRLRREIHGGGVPTAPPWRRAG